MLSDPARVEKEYPRRLIPQGDGVGWDTTEQLNAQMSKVKRGMSRLVDAYQDGLLDRERFEPRLKQAKERLAKLAEQARVQADEQAQQKELQLVIGRLQEFGERVRDGLQAADWSLRREIIRALVKQVEVDRDEVRIVYRGDYEGRVRHRCSAASGQ